VYRVFGRTCFSLSFYLDYSPPVFFSVEMRSAMVTLEIPPRDPPPAHFSKRNGLPPGEGFHTLYIPVPLRLAQRFLLPQFFSSLGALSVSAIQKIGHSSLLAHGGTKISDSPTVPPSLSDQIPVLCARTVTVSLLGVIRVVGRFSPSLLGLSGAFLVLAPFGQVAASYSLGYLRSRTCVAPPSTR